MEQKTENNYHHYIPLEERIKAGYMMTERDKLGKTVSEIETETQISRRHLYNLEKRYKADSSMRIKQDLAGLRRLIAHSSEELSGQ